MIVPYVGAVSGPEEVDAEEGLHGAFFRGFCVLADLLGSRRRRSSLSAAESQKKSLLSETYFVVNRVAPAAFVGSFRDCAGDSANTGGFCMRERRSHTRYKS